MSEKFAALKREGWHGFFATPQPICPHCGTEVDVGGNDLYRLYEEGEHEVSCPHCDDDFVVSTRVSFSFNTDSQDGA